MAKMGRPPSDNPRTNNIPVRLADNELATIRAAAEKAGITVGQYIRDRALAAAKRSR